MINLLVSATIFFSFLNISYAQFPESYWQQKADYEMNIILKDSSRVLIGNSIINYYNNSPDTLHRVYLHLYPNAFQPGSVKFREYNTGRFGRDSRRNFFKKWEDEYTAEIKIHECYVSQDNQLLSNTYKIEDTILEIPLGTPIFPNNNAKIHINWTHIIGQHIERYGYNSGQYNMSQWYPKMVVYDQQGWHNEPFHAEGEFYGEFGNYTVSLDVPRKFIVCATGEVVKGDPGWETVKVDTSIDFQVWADIFDSTRSIIDTTGRRNVKFFAKNVHDFAWLASEDFVYEHGKSDSIDIHCLFNISNGEDWSKGVIKKTKNVLSWLNEKFGKYPYSQVTVSDALKGGMEYPMLVMNGTANEDLISHEIGHIWFYGALANNETDEAWLDEGFTTFQEDAYMISRYGYSGRDHKDDNDYGIHKLLNYPRNGLLARAQWNVIDYIRSRHHEPLGKKTYHYTSNRSGETNHYAKSALMLNELRYLLGDKIFFGAMQSYYNTWKLKHVNRNSFISSIHNYTKKDLSWFFDSWLDDTDICDYGIYDWSWKKNDQNKWDITLPIKNKGDRFLPMLIHTTLEDGSVDSLWWWNKDSWSIDTLRYQVERKPMKITLDPFFQTLDVDFRNNTTKMSNHISFYWPGIDRYNPRDKNVLLYKPHMFYYRPNNDIAPGALIKYKYGPYQSFKLSLNYNYNKKNIFYDLEGWFSFVHSFPKTKFKYWTFDLPGVKEFGAEVEKKYNKYYGNSRNHYFFLGFYFQPKYDPVRSEAIGYTANSPNDKIGVSYLGWKSSRGLTKTDLNFSSTINPYSSWKFSKLTFVLTNSIEKGILKFSQRAILGKIFTDDKGVPGQEGFNLEGNASNDIIRKPYLLDQFYGSDFLFKHYHFPGEGNVRGFISKGEQGGEEVIATTLENSIKKNIEYLDLDVELANFFDFGFLGNDRNKTKVDYKTRFYSDFGFGIRFNKNILGQDYYLRIDFVIYNNKGNVGKHNWVFSFQKPI